MRGIWFIAGWISVAIGVIGIVLPLLPTVPLLLLAAICFAKSSDKAHDWLMNHKTLGPPIRDWRKNGAIKRSAKASATLCIAATFTISLFLGIAWWALFLQAAVLSCVALFIWTRPEN